MISYPITRLHSPRRTLNGVATAPRLKMRLFVPLAMSNRQDAADRRGGRGHTHRSDGHSCHGRVTPCILETGETTRRAGHAGLADIAQTGGIGAGPFAAGGRLMDRCRRIVAGVRWLLAWRSTYVWLVAPVAVTVGLLKGRVVLERSAVRIIERIRERGDDRCVGGFLSPKTWLLVLLMMVSGRVLRAALLPTPMVGFLYAAIGVALLWASRRLWGACQRPGAAS